MRDLEHYTVTSQVCTYESVAAEEGKTEGSPLNNSFHFHCKHRVHLKETEIPESSESLLFSFQRCQP